jgi:AraC family transcriptional regulator, regulatory protein of adaptative response / methylated-DNA-[protein]-cysteine methyltransferase
MFMTNDVNYSRVEDAIRYLSANFRQQPSLEEIAEHVHVSPFHFQRIFTEWAGISPKKFLQYLTVSALKEELQQSNNLIESAEKVGLSAQSRVYDLFVNIESVTPQEYKTKGSGIRIEYGFHASPFGAYFVANAERGICALSFVESNKEELLSSLSNEWKNASLVQHQKNTLSLAENIFSVEAPRQPVHVFLKGTKFQLKVWEALLKIPFGSVSSYRGIASAIGQNNAMRAVGSAIGNNPLAFLIPCHRVIRSEGVIGEYHWGSARKAAIIGWEKSQLALQSAV